MKYIDSVRRAGRSLGGAKGRTILTSLAIAVGAFTITLAVAAGTGVRSLVDDALNSNINPRSVSVAKAYDYEAEFSGGGASITEYDEDAVAEGESATDIADYTVTRKQVEAIEALDEVERVTVLQQLSPQYVALEGDDDKFTVSASSYDPDVLLEEVAGDLPELSQPLADDTVVVSENLANQLSNVNDVVGKQLQIQVISQATGEAQTFSYRIAAVAKPGSFSFVTGDLFAARNAADEMYDFSIDGTDMEDRYYGFSAVTADGYEPEQVRAAIENADDTLDAQTAEQVSESLFQVVNIAQYVIVGFGVIALVAAVFGIINTQYISVLERTREIGLMKALGMRGRHVRRLFQLEAAWIGALGGVIGAALAWLAGLALNPWISESLSLDDVSLLIFEPLPILLLIVVLTLIAMLAGWFPSRKAAKLDPIEALRTE